MFPTLTHAAQTLAHNRPFLFLAVCFAIGLAIGAAAVFAGREKICK